MEELKQKILLEGEVLSTEILKVDSFLNHQVDPIFTARLGEEIARRFTGEGVTRVLTAEASGIAVAVACGLALGVPVVFAKKKRAATQNNNVFASTVHSFTKDETVDIFVARKFIAPQDRILIVDDFLARGEALRGLVNIVQQSGSTLVGVGIVIEKVFQGGGRNLRESGVRIEALARINSLEEGKVSFI